MNNKTPDGRATPEKAATPDKTTTQEDVDEALEESFPASDPPAYSTPHKSETWKGPEGDGAKPAGEPGKGQGDKLKK